MQIDLYNQTFSQFFNSESIRKGIADAVAALRHPKRVMFIGNGGSNSICSHMMEDFMKMAGKQTLSFSDPALITCFANDYGYEQALKAWINFNFQDGDVLVAISSSGESKNIINAVEAHKSKGGKVITLSGFEENNTLSQLGDINFQTPIKNYGVVECFHQVILHAILDELV
jgi:D-sedoheptulose 7-phosphate isomerase